MHRSATGLLAAAARRLSSSSSLRSPLDLLNVIAPEGATSRGIKMSVDAYNADGFSVNGVHLHGDVLVFTHAALLWKPASQAITPASLAILPAVTPPIDVMLFGTGDRIVYLPDNVGEFLRSHHIKYEVMSSFHASATFNVLNAEDRQVACLLLRVADTPDTAS
ncbi:NADH dehydrogenase [ubiquinone] 1 alpha subcomplex assembly factor 3 [Plasmodiophora brassicae]|uniref:NADH dehydrogenase [ubiquinone] 1 alpha subcomplex assembly factor 3 n=1 Tax=Plasmodiophora brassicae TaxID=37360 RepID=A0A0G4IJK0_PLABS|nr:hypothetical protein PBRA_004021 [Plasmodiophora brassicae]SPQ96294.1 unnamed protein product [Plasmodiophora brassicae]